MNGEEHEAEGGGQRWGRKEMEEEKVKGSGTEQYQEEMRVQKSDRKVRVQRSASWRMWKGVGSRWGWDGLGTASFEFHAQSYPGLLPGDPRDITKSSAPFCSNCQS